tara:strand:- start:79 stop:354 length:276 start_codon:yes stop_codon:yes gene_type:complete
VKKVVEKIKEERAERENSLFFVFLSSCRQLAGLFFLNCGPRVKKKFTQFNAILSIFTKFTHQSRCCYFSVKAKSEYAHHQTKSTQKEKEFI